MWGSAYLLFHGQDRKYQYTPGNATAFVCANPFPQASRMLVMSKDKVDAGIATEGFPSGKSVILAFNGEVGNADKLVQIYNSLGYGVMKFGGAR